MDRCRIYPAAIRDLQAEGRLLQRCRRRTKRYANNRIESDHRQVKRRLRAMQGPRTIPTARRVIQGIEAVHMLRKAQLLGSKRTNLATISIAFALLLKMA
jgi:transposase, IS6 family